MAKLKLSYEEEMLQNLSEPIGIEKVKKKRKILEYYDSVMKGKLHLTISGLKTAKNIFNLVIDDNFSSLNRGSSFLFNMN